MLPHIIEAVLNHVSGHKAGVAGIYNRSSYEPEKRQALNLWADHVMALVRWAREQRARQSGVRHNARTDPVIQKRVDRFS